MAVNDFTDKLWYGVINQCYSRNGCTVSGGESDQELYYGGNLKDKTLILMVGLPRSGKSTWAMNYSKLSGAVVVNPDAVRLAFHGQVFNQNMENYVWAIVRTMVKTLFKTGYDTVILDATNITRRRRNEWLSNEWNTKFKVIDTPIETCIKRAEEQILGYLVPVIKRIHKQWEDLTEEELKKEIH